MKALKIAAISLLVLVFLLIAAAAIIVTTVDVNKFKPQIIEQAAKVLARKVDFQHAQLGIGFNGIGVKISGLNISEDPAFGKGEFLSVKTITVGIDVFGYLFTRRIGVTGIVIDTPSVTIIRAKDGVINAQTIAKPPAAGPGGGSVSAVAPAPSPVDIPVLFISSLRGQNGTVRYIDHSFEPPVTFEVENVAFLVSGLSLTDAFPFSVQATVLGEQQNIKLEGKCQIELKTLAVRVFDIKASADLARFVLKKIPGAVPMVPATALPRELKGSLDVSVPSLVADAKGLGSLNAGAVLSGGLAAFPQMAVPVKDIAVESTVTEKDFLLNSFSAAIGKGSVKGSGWVKNYLTGQDFSFEINAEKLNIADLVSPDQPVKAEGTLAAQGKIKGHGFVPEALRTNMVGDATVNISGATMKGVNVLRIILDKLAEIPVLGGSVEYFLPDQYKQNLQQKDTSFSDFQVPVTIVNGGFFIKDTTIPSELFTFKCKGAVQLNGSYAVEGAFLFSQAMSADLVARLKLLRYLLNEDQMISIPLKVDGTAGEQLKFNVDKAYIVQKLFESNQQQIMKGLGKLLGQQPDGQPASQGQEQQGQQASPQGDQQPVEQAVGKLLKGIFK
jgi:hypothetical protein